MPKVSDKILKINHKVFFAADIEQVHHHVEGTKKYTKNKQKTTDNNYNTGNHNSDKK